MSCSSSPCVLFLLKTVLLSFAAVEMSFGFSPSDIVALVNITSKAYNGWKRACGEYSEITGSLDSLLIVLERIESEAAKPSSVLLRTTNDRQDLKDILANAEPTVRELYTIILHYKSLGSSREKNWDRLRLGVKNLGPLRVQLTQHVTVISAYLDAVGLGALGRIERHLNAIPEQMQRTIDGLAAEIRAGRREGSIMTTYSDDEKDVWKQFRRELIGDGMKSKEIHKYKPLIRLYLKELAERGELEELPPVVDNEMPLDCAVQNESVRNTSQPEAPQPVNESTEQRKGSAEGLGGIKDMVDTFFPTGEATTETQKAAPEPMHASRISGSDSDESSIPDIGDIVATSSRVELKQPTKDRPRIVRDNSADPWDSWKTRSKKVERSDGGWIRPIAVSNKNADLLARSVASSEKGAGAQSSPRLSDAIYAVTGGGVKAWDKYSKDNNGSGSAGMARGRSETSGTDQHSTRSADEDSANVRTADDRKDVGSSPISSQETSATDTQHDSLVSDDDADEFKLENRDDDKIDVAAAKSQPSLDSQQEQQPLMDQNTLHSTSAKSPRYPITRDLAELERRKSSSFSRDHPPITQRKPMNASVDLDEGELDDEIGVGESARRSYRTVTVRRYTCEPPSPFDAWMSSEGIARAARAEIIGEGGCFAERPTIVITWSGF